MDQLIKMITDKTGISMEQAQGAIETVMDFVGDKLPAPIANQVKGLMGGDAGSGEGGGVGDLLGKAKEGLGGLLGGD
ncbi:MAG: hypothetical protein HKN07_09160 [Acidimicrobiia bacterium]|nr:hypothetical protein [Acidimicrobiia bacterium]